MAVRLKRDIASKISKCLLQNTNGITAAMEMLPTADQNYVIHIKSDEGQEIFKSLNNIDFRFKIKNETPISDIVEFKNKHKNGFNLKIEPHYFVKSILTEIVYPIHTSTISKQVVVEYSSPNIAKPFHIGHLRSTIIGQYLVNINKYLGENVKSINYLGDWGTQFGLLQKGIDLLNKSDEEIKINPMKFLYEAYVYANKQAEINPEIYDDARLIFSKMEKGEDDMQRWKVIREFTVAYLRDVYERIGITFDEYNWESMYTLNNIQTVLQTLEMEKVAQTDEFGRKYVDINDEQVTIKKTDGSTLYLTRDIAAALDRYDRHKFDEMFYVVDSSQGKHFRSLFTVLENMKVPFAKCCRHVPYGRIRGMSSRKGTVVFLNDILDEAKDKMHKKRLQSPTRKGALEDEKVADILGISAIKINDLKQGRMKNYDFDWDRVLQSEGDSGVKLQYVHCRLWSIEQNSGLHIPQECVPEYLTEGEAVDLIHHLSRFDEEVEKSRLQIEPCVLVVYLFKLCNSINRAIKVLRVKDESHDLATQRLLLFHASRLTLKRGLEILGITPLNEM